MSRKQGSGGKEERITVISFSCLSFHNFFLPMPAGVLTCLVPEPRDRSTSLLLIQVGRGCGSRVVTLPDVPKLQLGCIQQQSHSVNSSLFLFSLSWLGPSTTHSLTEGKPTDQKLHRSPCLKTSLSLGTKYHLQSHPYSTSFQLQA